MHPALKWSLRIVGGLLALLVLVVGGALFWLSTGSGRAFVLARAEQAVPGLSITGAEGGLFDLRAGSITLADARGVWLMVEDARLDWSPLALLTRTVQVDRLAAGNVVVARTPVAGEQAEPEPAGQPFELPVSIDLDRLEIARAELGPDLLGGQTAVLAAEGSAAIPSGAPGGEVALTVRRIDDRPGSAALKAAYLPDRRLTLDLTVEEPANGVMAGLLDIPGRPPVTVTLRGDGPPTDWTGALTATAGDVVALEAEARLRPVAGGFTFGGTANGDIAALLPEAARPLVGDRLTLAAGGLVRPGDRVALDGVTLTVAAGTLAGQGVYEFQPGTVSTGFTVTVGPDSAVHTILTEPVFAGARLETRVAGPLAAPTVRTSLAVDQPAVRQFTAEALALDLAADPQDGFGRWAFTLESVLRGFAADDPALAALVGPAATLATGGSVATEGGVVRLDRIALDTPALTAGGTAALSGWGAEATAELRLAAPDLAALSGLAGRDLSGAVTATADVARDAAGLRADLRAEGADLSTGIPAADALLGTRTEVAASVRVADAVRVPRLVVTTPRLTLEGSAALEGGELTAKAEAALPDLAPLGEAIGTPLSGALTLTAATSGPTEALVAELDGRATDLTVNGQPFGATTLEALVRGLPSAPEGRLALNGSLRDAPLLLSGGFALAGGTLRVEELDARVGANRLQGGVTADLAAGTADGALTADLPEIATIGALVGQPVAGTATAAVTLDSAGGRQRVVLEATARDLARRQPDGTQTVETLRLAGRVDDAVTAPRLDLRLDASDIAAAGARLDDVAVTVRGPASELAFTGKASGTVRREVALSTNGTVVSKGADTTVVLDALDGRFDGEAFRLTRTARLTVGGPTLRVQGLDIRSGDARLALDATLGEKDFTGEAVLTDVPMALAQLADETLDLDGRLDAKANLSGTVQAPRGSLTLRLNDVRSRGLAESTGVTGLDLALDGDWRDGRVDLKAKAESGRGGIDLTAAASLPLVLAGGPLAFSVPEDGRLRADVDGSVQLDRFNDLLATTGDRVAGRAQVDLALAGTVGDPDLTGTIALDDGRYENQLLGTTIADITARIVGDPDGLAIQRFTGRTPATGGTVELTGNLRFEPGDQPQIDVRLRADRARVVETDLATAVADASLGFTGSFDEALLAGEVRIREARIQVPESLPRQVVDLEVSEVGGEVAEIATRTVPIPGRKPGGDASGPGAPGDDPGDAAPPPGMVVNLALDVTAPNQIYVQGRGLDAEFQADLDIGGTAAEPLVTGTVSRVKGELALLGQTFELARATFTFVGDGTLEPALDIQARTTRGDLTAIVNVTGRPSSPQVKLESDPPAPEDEVLARLLFNRGVGQLSALEAVQLAQSAGQLTGVLGGGPGILDTVKRSLGVDRLEFRGSETGEGPGTVAAGRYVGQNVYVGVEQELGTGQSKATVQYDVNENIRLEGAVGSESRAGVQFEWDY